NKTVPIELGLYRFEIPRLHHRVYREAILNAVIHRSYMDYGSVYIRQYPDRLVVTNPGGFLPGVGPHNLLSGNARPRNRRIAEAFQSIGLVERAGMGVPKMYRYQIETGKAVPEFEAGENHVKITISTEQIDQNLAAF